MNLEQAAISLLQPLYASPGNPEGWRAFLLALCDALDATDASFVSHNRHQHEGDISVSAKADPMLVRDSGAHWGQLDPRAHRPTASQLATGAAGTGKQLVRQSALRRTSCYTDVARPHEITQALAGMVEAGPDGLSFLSINGSDRRAPFGPDEIHLLQMLMPHVQRALQIHRRLIVAESTQLAASGALAFVGHGVMFVDATLRILDMNKEARRVLECGDALLAQRGHLRAVHTRTTTELRQRVGNASLASHGQGLGAGGMVVIKRPAPNRPLRLVVAPVVSEWPFDNGKTMPAAMLLTVDSERIPVPTASVIRDMLGLTNAEAGLVRALAMGLSVSRYATDSGIAIGTARTRLKTVFEKTDVHRQSDLVRLVIRGASGSH